MKRTRMKASRDPRRREAPQWTAEEWAIADTQLRRRSGGRCECCGSASTHLDSFERHHRMRRRDGGDRLANVILLRRSCHQWWTEHPAAANTIGVIVRTGHDVTAVPLLHKGQHWVVLDDDGSTLPAQAPAERDTPDS